MMEIQAKVPLFLTETNLSQGEDVLDETTLEQSMIEAGVYRYNSDLQYKKAHGMMTSSEWPLFRQAFPTVADSVYGLALEVVNGRKRQDWQDILCEVGTDNAAFIGLQVAFSKALERKHETDVASIIGRQIYAQLDKTPEVKDEVTLGLQVLGSVLESGLFVLRDKEEVRGYTTLEFTEEAVAQMHSLEEWQRYMRPVYRPMVSRPNSVMQGSYLDPKLASTVTMVKTTNKEHKKLIHAAAKGGAKFVEAADIIQAVPLKINQWALGVIEKAYKANLAVGSIPPSSLPSQGRLRSQIRSQQACFLTDIHEAKEFSGYDEVFLPATLDFRGRVYAKPHLNHQRADYVKALWMFSEGKPLDIGGLAFLKIHLANCGDFDKVSKAPFKKRLEWVSENLPKLLNTVSNPFEDLWWTKADSPFCFLAACHELAAYYADPDGYVCHLPVSIDGSCSGLQHYSAMLRDAEGADYVNLIAGEEPMDVYKEVSNIVNELVLNDQDNEHAQEWLAHKIDRKVTKRATMTLCYGSKQYGWREQLMEDFMAQYTKEVQLGQRKEHPFKEPGKASGYMAKKLDVALRKTVKAAVEGMDWLQEVSSLLASENKPVIWTTPIGFPVVNGYYEPILKQVDIKIKGKRKRQQLLLGYTDKLKRSKQRSTIAPNFVHSFDACHLMMVALEAKKQGIDSFLLIHDSFGCLPSDMALFSFIVREQFVKLYENHDPFQAIHENALIALSDKGKAKLEPPPAKGTLDIHSVLDSQYAFA
jgi:DNA-directed RNA polymerase, mitochondrial